MDSREPLGLVIRDLHLEIANYLTKLLAPFRLAPEQHLLMALMLEKEGLSQNEIAANLGKDKASVARMIASLESKGYIRKVTSAQDRRAVNVYVTEEGRKLENTINEVTVNLNEIIESGLSASDYSTLKTLLTRVQDNVRGA
ncbi:MULTISPECIES: MarR family transcriptional regulator [Paenibacillus]|uniref:Transcriptional regulator n=1 Tax=Paenibacillus odorifer TaxID=189426 RepID=A0A1R0XA44_9BACL|nr:MULTISPECIES: MarR family transcriptional regulator [Paenibacillus]AIQ75264.1 multidrug resistance operon repressor family protein [Paenibacillus odorifer]ETT46130.1 MarR family transcriptional regulator [Paenibacillus sp. FSL H8-237]OMD31683.1 transcriptional regulator [Paenibacillus odorifer]OME26823.1 transcriptional regulator [Paenibacillus odorifer]OME37297.1 transcriptional regulator [Paenibacillus odorifer]